MGSCSSAQICFGVPVMNRYELPWVEEGIDIEDWWEKTKGFKPSVKLYDEYGNYIEENPKQEVVDAYYAEIDTWWDLNPIPVMTVRYSHYEEPEYILAVRGSYSFVDSGETLDVLPAIASTPNPREIHDLKEFIRQYTPEVEICEPTWLMSAEYG